MRSQALPQAESRYDSSSFAQLGRVARRLATALSAFWAVLTVLTLFSGALGYSQTTSAQTSQAQANPAQANPPAPAAIPVHKHVHPRKKPAAAAPVSQPAPPPAPVVPKPPDWPANDQPAPASVVFDSRGLLIVASNSSLAQILKEVSIDTGAKVEGMGADQRIFGAYGPDPARDVLNQLLDGSGYNVLLIGDRGEGTPRQIILSPQSGGITQNTANNTASKPNEADTDSDQSPPEPEAEQEPPPPQNGAGPPVPVRNPQQIMQEIQERQRLEQNQNQQNPQN